MKSLNVNYKDLKSDQSCLKILPLEYLLLSNHKTKTYTTEFYFFTS